jgi:ABC-2 type transport system ATP-binding protein
VDGEHLDAAIRHLTGFGIRALTSQPPTLEELMLRHYEGGPAGTPEGTVG